MRMRTSVLCAAVFVVFSYSANTVAAAQGDSEDVAPAIAGGGFHFRTETLTPREREDLYLKLIEDFLGWAEGEYWVDSDVLETGGGYFKAKGRGVTWARGNSNLCVAYAVLLSVFPDRQRFTGHGIPRSLLQDHLRKTMRALCLSNKNCMRHIPESHTWGGPSWQASLEFIGCAWAAHLMEDTLDRSTRDLVAEVLAKEADNLDKPIPSGKTSDTKSEDCIWNAPLLAFAANKLATDPRAARWDRLARKWALNATSIAGDTTSSTIVDGHPLSDWIMSENVFVDLTLENHGFWSVPYQFEYGLMGQGDLAYRVFGKPVPEAFRFRARQMWRDVNAVVSLWDGDTLFPHGQDWAWKDYQHIEYFCRQGTSLGNPAASAFESRALQMLRKRQLTGGTGSVCDYDFGYQTSLAQPWAFSYLLHRYFPPAKTISYEQAEAAVYGVHVYPYVRTAIHRTRQKLVSVSWHPRSQAIFILPEGSSTFADPPFFVPYDRDSANTRLIVRAGPGVTVSAADRKNLQPTLERLESTHAGKGMHIVVRRPWGLAVTQYTTIVSLPDEATIYSTVFRAHTDAEVEIAPLFPLRMAMPSGFDKHVRRYRGTNWVNISDHIAFVSPRQIPEDIPEDRFFLTERRTFRVKAGQWFSPVAVVVYVRQLHRETGQLARRISLVEAPRKKELKLSILSSNGATEIDLWPRP